MKFTMPIAVVIASAILAFGAIGTVSIWPNEASTSAGVFENETTEVSVTQQPTETVTPTATETRVPTNTPSATSAPTATPTDTATPSLTPIPPTATRVPPTATPRPPTATPTAVPAPTPVGLTDAEAFFLIDYQSIVGRLITVYDNWFDVEIACWKPLQEEATNECMKDAFWPYGNSILALTREVTDLGSQVPSDRFWPIWQKMAASASLYGDSVLLGPTNDSFWPTRNLAWSAHMSAMALVPWGCGDRPC